ncbi:MAG: isoprenylcysteine carboxylmethyltransferase family protein [Pseudomonadales bacterium]|nr:isoprenylcysteine carboxylmethyltransferase family protein [Pseudomonadales bacterium]
MNEERDGADVRIIPPLVPVVAIIAGVLLDYVWPIDPGFEISPLVRYGVGGLIVLFALLVLGLWPAMMFRSTNQSVIPWTSTSEVVARGPYRWTRNPMYLQMVLVCIGVAIILVNVWIFLLSFVCGWVIQRFAILPEEAYLERKFGDGYVAYKKSVRRWL